MNSFNPLAAIKTGWRCAKEHFIVSLGLVLTITVVSTLLSLIPAGGVVGSIGQLLNLLVSLIWSLGIVRLTLDVVDGEEPRFGVFKEILPRLLHFVVLMIIMSIFMFIPACAIVGIGAASCGVSLTTLTACDPMAISTVWLWVALAFVPVIYISLRFFFAPYLLIDRGLGPIEALKMSWKASYPLQGGIFVFLLIATVIAIVGLVCFFVGLFFSTIIVMYAQAALYRQAFSAGIQDPLLVEDTNVVVS